MPGYDHKTGIMEEGLMNRILDKIKSENPEAIVFLYGNSEPFLHPRLPECIQAVKARGLRCEFSTNLNFVQRVDETLLAKPDFIIISVSGWTQEIYERGHSGGKIDKVKENMAWLSLINGEHKIPISVNFHLYNDNEHELQPMKEFAEHWGFGFFTSNARAISMENAIQYIRWANGANDGKLGIIQDDFEIQPGRPDWNKAFPKTSPQWIKTMPRLKISPLDAKQMYGHYRLSTVCPVGAGSMFTFIRHDGKTQLCACTADRRITLTDYLDTTPEKLMEERVGHAICKLCIKNRLNLYFHIVDREKW
jgi:MoaA/NifB/PqqE/SkfB family radical SAM enzyme